MKNRTRNIWLAVILAFTVMQLFPIDQTNPESDPSSDFMAIENPPEQVKVLLKNTCYDCHSVETRYPWYANISPVSWFLNSHITEAREKMNFSKWNTYSLKDRTEMAEEVIEECASFPHGQYDDYVDSTTQAVLRYRQGNFVSTYMDEPEPMKIEGEYKYYV